MLVQDSTETVKSKRKEYLAKVLPDCRFIPSSGTVEFFAPSNIAISKYWGKRDSTLFLPENSSLSLSLGKKGALTKLSVTDLEKDKIILNGQKVDLNSRFAKPIVEFLSLFKDLKSSYAFEVNTQLNIAHSSGLASSACGFAALTLCLNELFNWELSLEKLSLIARLGSGSASRSLFNGFVQWNRGSLPCGTDSFASPIDVKWPQLRWGILSSTKEIKKVSSRQAMTLSKETSVLYASWPSIAQQHFELIKSAVLSKSFCDLGELMEQNCELMHAVIQSSRPGIFFRNSTSLALIEKVRSLRAQQVNVFYTQDAGHHIKVLFLEKDLGSVKDYFGTDIEILNPFNF